jgi:hypothetical protein
MRRDANYAGAGSGAPARDSTSVHFLISAHLRRLSEYSKFTGLLDLRTSSLTPRQHRLQQKARLGMLLQLQLQDTSKQHALRSRDCASSFRAHHDRIVAREPAHQPSCIRLRMIQNRTGVVAGSWQCCASLRTSWENTC